MPGSTTARRRIAQASFAGLVACLLSAGAAFGQSIAVLAPDDADGSRVFAAKLETVLGQKAKLVDDALARSAFAGVGLASPYDLSLDEARRAGQAIGCDFFVLVRSSVRRQSSFEREEYYDAYAGIFLVSARSGRLIDHRLTSELGDKPDAALERLDLSIPATAELLLEKVRSAARDELAEKPPSPMEEPPDEGSAAVKNFRAPVPFRRLKPEYTKLADQYDVTATVDIVVDLDAEGHVLRTEIVRWAGYGLDESVDRAVRSMNWRPAERDGKFIPMRFLVRYNFKKAEKPQK